MKSKINIIFFGTPKIAEIVLNEVLNSDLYNVAAVVTQPDKKSGRGKKVLFSPVKELALKYKIPVFQPNKLKKEKLAFLDNLSSINENIHIGLVVAYGQIIPMEILENFDSGCINLHVSKLPRWRGAAPIQRAIMAGDTFTAATIMKMDEGLDTGPIFIEKHIDIEPDYTSGKLHDILADAGAKLVVENLYKIVHGEIKSTPQNKEGITYAKKIQKQEAHIDWTKKTVNIINQIRGLSPFPGAFSILSNKRLKVLRATIKITNDFNLSDFDDGQCDDGQCIVENGELLIKCSDGLVKIIEVKPEGKKAMKAEEFIKGNKINGKILI